MALSITSATSETAARVLSGLEQLRGCDAFFSVIISPTDETVPVSYTHLCQFHTEGGDVLNINEKTLAVGISQRTQAAAIDVMAQNLSLIHI